MLYDHNVILPSYSDQVIKTTTTLQLDSHLQTVYSAASSAGMHLHPPVKIETKFGQKWLGMGKIKILHH